jgi:DNA-binding MarR family transcriptional regulator
LIAELWFSDECHDRFHAACGAEGLTPPQLKALLSMRPGEAKPMRALADRWRCDASWVTGIVDGLEEKGLVERRVLPADRRVKTVSITPLGEKAKQRALELLEEPPAAVAALDPADQRSLRDLLRKVVSRDTTALT